MTRIKYSKELLLAAVLKSYSIADVCRELNLVPVGGNYYTIKRKCKEYQIDISHFTGQNWNLNPKLDSNRILLSDLLVENINFKPSKLKLRLINSGLKLDLCELCGCTSIWLNKPITLELHHVNGDHFDNRIENLQILCPNCHSLLKGHRIPKINHKKEVTFFYKKKLELKHCTCLYCYKEFWSNRLDKTRKFCSIDCYRKYLQKFGTKDIENHKSVTILSLEEVLEKINNCFSISELARQCNVHRSTMREFLKKNSLYDLFIKNKIVFSNEKV